MTHNKKPHEILLIALFVAFLCLGFVDVFFGIDPAPRQSKHQADLPSLPTNVRQLAKLPGDLKLYCSFNYGLQDSLLLAHGRLKYSLLNTSPNTEVLLGENGWLYMNREQSLDYFRNLYPLSAADESAWQQELLRRRDHARQAGAVYLLTVAPNKHTIYPEFIPKHLVKRQPESRLDQLTELISRIEPAYPFIDLRPALLEAKSRARIYHKTDTHWNSLGAAIAYRQIIDALAVQFPHLADKLFDVLNYQEVDLELGGDLARLVGLKYSLLETDLKPIHSSPARRVVDAQGNPVEFRVIDIRFQDRFETTCHEGEINEAIIFLDSFGVIMIPYLAQHFRHAVYHWQDDYDANIVAQAKPDVVIQQVVERRLMKVPSAEK